MWPRNRTVISLVPRLTVVLRVLHLYWVIVSHHLGALLPGMWCGRHVDKLINGPNYFLYFWVLKAVFILLTMN